MKILLMLPTLFLLSGCVDLGDVGIHPEEETYYINQGKNQVIDCLHYAASKANLSLEYDDALPENIDKYNLMNTENTTVAWVEISNFNGRQTSVEFYYAPHAPDIHRSVTTIAERCS
ncbi:hypothetical protein ACJ5X2_004532 [Klebsiella quasipneumoniae]|uniref:hypothetical protein n=1 Tax=Klebsiella quasipneumoniae TaxID=1463165 RepID=UPI0015A74D82|nr:hypothetical protein [Klebsiella quasipneumoniae]MDJ1029904.1 hypothetical protein [Klebsiella quasipneumoniae]HBW1842703.1 hypothetical protein [Klebsiella quasipneumoniae subsp. quasipneumoniae]HCI6931845.1 hypothetical protein [Klebsiella quasipneumoniae subsp. quasipneumoniae]HCM7674263.1 hypothetical protein [Klebsiella quasipneumoniae subsp. quasipneumoniae]